MLAVRFAPRFPDAVLFASHPLGELRRHLPQRSVCCGLRDPASRLAGPFHSESILVDVTLIVCLGNPLAADDGAGHAVFAELSRSELPATVRLKCLGLGGIDLLDELDGEKRLIVVDAVQLGAAPGTVHLLTWEQLPIRHLRPVSGHGIGIREAIEVGRKLYPERIPGEIFLVGIEGQCFDQLTEELTQPVAASISDAVGAVTSLLDGYNDYTGAE